MITTAIASQTHQCRHRRQRTQHRQHGWHDAHDPERRDRDRPRPVDRHIRRGLFVGASATVTVEVDSGDVLYGITASGSPNVEVFVDMSSAEALTVVR